MLDKNIDLSGLLYFGGVHSSKLGQARAQGMRAVTPSWASVAGGGAHSDSDVTGLRGCLRDIELDGRRIGLPEVLETSGIGAGCVWDYPCLAKAGSGRFPCVPGSVCFQRGTAGFRCECDGPVCTKTDNNSGAAGESQPPQPTPARPPGSPPVPVRSLHLIHYSQYD